MTPPTRHAAARPMIASADGGGLPVRSQTTGDHAGHLARRSPEFVETEEGSTF